jgi:hypothetical protein
VWDATCLSPTDGSAPGLKVCGAFYGPNRLECVAAHWSRLVAGSVGGELYHLELAWRTADTVLLVRACEGQSALFSFRVLRELHVWESLREKCMGELPKSLLKIRLYVSPIDN